MIKTLLMRSVPFRLIKDSNGKPVAVHIAFSDWEKMQLLDNEEENNELIFWQILSTAASDTEKAEQLLSEMPLSFFPVFEEFLAQKLFALDSRALAEQIYSPDKISSDDFLYVRCFCLIQGREFYEKLLSGQEKMPSASFEYLLSLSERAYFRKTSSVMPAFLTSLSYETGSNIEAW